MSDHSVHQSLSRRGSTIVEALLALAISAILVSITAGLLMCAIKSHLITGDHTDALSQIRKTLEYSGTYPGIVRQARRASAVTSLSPDQPAFTNPDLTLVQYILTGSNLAAEIPGRTSTVAQRVSRLEVTYYTWDSVTGIRLATATVNADLITLTMGVTSRRGRTSALYDAAGLRNHP